MLLSACSDYFQSLFRDNSYLTYFFLNIEFKSTACGHRMSHRKWKETKQQPSMLPGPAVPGCSLVSFHFLWAILCPQAVWTAFNGTHSLWDHSADHNDLLFDIKCIAKKFLRSLNVKRGKYEPFLSAWTRASTRSSSWKMCPSRTSRRSCSSCTTASSTSPQRSLPLSSRWDP